MRRLAALVCLLLPLAAQAEPVIDWAGGRLAVTSAAAADLRAPSPEIARVAAERTARARARAELLVAARRLPWAGGGTLGEHADADPDALKALDLAVDGAEAEEVRIQSDGSVTLVLSASLDGLAGRTPTKDRARVVIDGRKHAVAPALGYRLVAGKDGKDRYTGPVRFVRGGGRSVGAVSRKSGGELTVTGGGLENAVPPVLILVNEGAR